MKCEMCFKEVYTIEYMVNIVAEKREVNKEEVDEEELILQETRVELTEMWRLKEVIVVERRI